jgi:hypothetical protein
MKMSAFAPDALEMQDWSPGISFFSFPVPVTWSATRQCQNETKTICANLNCALTGMAVGVESDLAAEPQLLDQVRIPLGHIKHRVNDDRIPRDRIPEQEGVCARHGLKQLAKDQAVDHDCCESSQQGNYL